MSRPCTACPSRSSLWATWKPMNPAAPVTRIMKRKSVLSSSLRRLTKENHGRYARPAAPKSAVGTRVSSQVQARAKNGVRSSQGKEAAGDSVGGEGVARTIAGECEPEHSIRGSGISANTERSEDGVFVLVGHQKVRARGPDPRAFAGRKIEALSEERELREQRNVADQSDRE